MALLEEVGVMMLGFVDALTSSLLKKIINITLNLS